MQQTRATAAIPPTSTIGSNRIARVLETTIRSARMSLAAVVPEQGRAWPLHEDGEIGTIPPDCHSKKLIPDAADSAFRKWH
jgi:hypothetical protein